MFNRELRTRFSLLQPDVAACVSQKQGQQIEQHNQHAKPRSFEEGQQVMVRDFHPNKPKWIPGTVVQKSGPLSYVINVGPGIDWKRHVDHIRESLAQADSELNPPDISTDQYIDVTPYTSGENASTTATTESSSTDDNTRRYPARQRNQPDRFM